MALVLSVPGKTFLAGEYLALHEGPSLVFNSQPTFELEVKEGRQKNSTIHAESPAGLFIRKHSDFFDRYDLTFHDPYSGRGGLGASTAQFLSVYGLLLCQGQASFDFKAKIDLKKLLEAYYEVSWSGAGRRPSGADLVGQLFGAFTFFDKSQLQVASIQEWPFTDIEFSLVHTGNKVATHEHLQSLTHFNSDELAKSFQVIQKSFENKNSTQFIEGINSYAQALLNLNFVCQKTQELLKTLGQVQGVLAAKGCGALGADIILAITTKGSQELLKQFCKINSCNLVSSNKDLSEGLKIRGPL